MTEPEQPTRILWARAYARQARSDRDIYEILVKQGAPRCHQVHYLQMAAEKVAKGYRFRDTSTPHGGTFLKLSKIAIFHFEDIAIH